MERKLNIDEFNERIESKVDKTMIANALNMKANKQDID
jgi:hypothetical protein